MKIVLRAYGFIKSWRYYPTMKNMWKKNAKWNSHIPDCNMLYGIAKRAFYRM